MPDNRTEAERLAREEAERTARSHEDLARSKFIGPAAEPPPQQARAEPLAPDFSQPPPFQDHISADARKFEQQRRDTRDYCAERLKAEIEKTVGEIDTAADDDMRKIVEEQTRQIQERWALMEADRIAQIDRQQQLALERAQRLYGRG